ncbi:MAG: hypothetical protein HQL67_00175 [Magnetococcales bacterium]|nr:hypothetical protein [Magnetococcales bacterium]
MTVIVNGTVLLLLTFILFNVASQGLTDLNEGLSGGFFFSALVIIHLVAVFQIIFKNMISRKSVESVHEFFSQEAQNTFRGHPDILVKMVSWIGTLCWGLLIVFLVTLQKATPETPLDTPLNHLTDPSNWSSSWSHYAYTQILLLALLSALGLVIKSRRNKRDTDRYPTHLVLIFVLCSFGTIYLF